MPTPKISLPAAWDRDSPGIEEVASRLRFSFEDAQIWLDEERMVLMHSSALGCLRKELIETLGLERARGLLTRMGFASGQRDAEIVRKRYPGVSDLELLHKGPLLVRASIRMLRQILGVGLNTAHMGAHAA